MTKLNKMKKYIGKEVVWNESYKDNMLNDTEILRMYINVQYCFMNGSFHADDGDHTVLLMITPTLKKNSGEFHIKENNKKLKKISFVQNRLIKFPSLWEHKGCSPTEKNTPRITLVFKTRKHN